MKEGMMKIRNFKKKICYLILFSIFFFYLIGIFMNPSSVPEKGKGKRRGKSRKVLKNTTKLQETTIIPTEKTTLKG